jgi:hypothetical protein
MRALAALLALLASPAAAAADEWKLGDTALEGAFVAVLAADYAQTKQIAEDGREGNPVIGSHGERVAPAVYFPIVAVAHVAVARALPGRWRTAFQGISLGWQVDAVHTNLQAGYAIEF